MISCGDDSSDSTDNTSNTIPDFAIVTDIDASFSVFDRKIEVFGIDVYAVPDVSSDRLVHAAHIMAQYLDNNEDGVVDNQLVVNEIVNRKL